MAGLLPIRKYDESKLLALRDGLVFVLYMRKAHVEICEHVDAVFDEYVRLVGEDTLEWIHDRGEFYRPFTAKKKARIHQLLQKDFAEKKQDELFTIKGGCAESEAAAYLFMYRGRDMKGRLADVNTSFIEMWFPTEFPEKIGYEAFVNCLLSMSEKVPFTSGYCSIAFNREDWAVIGTDAYVRAKAIRYPGIDIHSTMDTAIRIGEGVRGAYWLTLLGVRALESLQLDVSTIGPRLGPDIMVIELRNGLAIKCGEKPETGDINRKDNLPLVRKVASLVEPIQHIQTVGIFGFEEVDEFVNWQRRHLL